MNIQAIAKRVAGEWNGRSFEVSRPDVEKSDKVLRFLVAELEDLLDRYRNNEGVETRLVKMDKPESVEIEVALTEHEAVDAMLKKVEDLIRKIARRKRLEVERI